MRCNLYRTFEEGGYRHQPAVYRRSAVPAPRQISSESDKFRARDLQASNAIAKRILETLGEISLPFHVSLNLSAFVYVFDVSKLGCSGGSYSRAFGK